VAYRLLGQCAVTPTAQMSAACQGEGRSLQAYCATRVNPLMLHWCEPSALEMEKLFQLGAISFPLPPGWRGALHAGSFTRFWRFTIE